MGNELERQRLSWVPSPGKIPSNVYLPSLRIFRGWSSTVENNFYVAIDIRMTGNNGAAIVRIGSQ